MSGAVLISIRPEWCQLIALGKKTLEIRKSTPHLPRPFKCYIYCTKGDTHSTLCIKDGNEYGCGKAFGYCTQDGNEYNCGKAFRKLYCGKVIGEFICDNASALCKHHIAYIEKDALLPKEKLFKYLGVSENTDLTYENMGCFGWHIDELKIYDKPRELSEFYKFGTLSSSDFEYQLYDGSGDPRHNSYASYLFTQAIRRPPQSWRLVEELEG